MSKSSGLGNRLYVAGYDISGDVGAISNASTPRGVQDITGIDKSAHERLLLNSSGEIGFDSFWNEASDQIHDVLSSLPTTDRQAIYARSATTRGGAGLAMGCKQIDYNWNRPADGTLTGTTQLLSSDGFAPAWGEMIAMKETIASAGNLDGFVDAGGAQTTAGVVAYLQIFTLGSGTPTVILEDSSDTTDGTDGTWSTVGTFTIQSARSTERITASGNVEKGLRLRASGTFTNLVVACLVRRGTAQDD